MCTRVYPSDMSASGEDGRTDLDILRQDYPGWQFGSVWASVASGPDARRIYATKGGRLITAWTAAQLAAAIRGEEQDGP
jgi:hypothetical protein